MRHVALVLAVALAAGLVSKPSAAADMPLKAPPVAPVYMWSGLYVGANLGYGWGNANWENLENTTLFGDNVPGDTFDHRMSGVIGGGQLGYNYQTGAWVLGAELLVDASGIEGNHASTAGAADDQFKARIDALMLLTGRVGYAWNNVLVYGKAGLGAADIHASVSDTVGPSTGSGSDSGWHFGPTVGLGLEYGITPNLSFAIEYDYVHLKSGSYQLGDTTGSYLWDIDVHNINLLMAKLNYRFNTSR